MSRIQVDRVLAAGNGRNKAPAGPVPDVERGDCDRDPGRDYTLTTDNLCRAWIRRAVLAETFAKSLEAELNRYRQETDPCPSTTTQT